MRTHYLLRLFVFDVFDVLSFRRFVPFDVLAFDVLAFDVLSFDVLSLSLWMCGIPSVYEWKNCPLCICGSEGEGSSVAIFVHSKKRTGGSCVRSKTVKIHLRKSFRDDQKVFHKDGFKRSHIMGEVRRETQINHLWLTELEKY